MTDDIEEGQDRAYLDELSEDDEPDPDDCHDCGMCEWCIDRTVSYAEEQSGLWFPDDPRRDAVAKGPATDEGDR